MYSFVVTRDSPEITASNTTDPNTFTTHQTHCRLDSTQILLNWGQTLMGTQVLANPKWGQVLANLSPDWGLAPMAQI